MCFSQFPWPVISTTCLDLFFPLEEGDPEEAAKKRVLVHLMTSISCLPCSVLCPLVDLLMMLLWFDCSQLSDASAQWLWRREVPAVALRAGLARTRSNTNTYTSMRTYTKDLGVWVRARSSRCKYKEISLGCNTQLVVDYIGCQPNRISFCNLGFKQM